MTSRDHDVQHAHMHPLQSEERSHRHAVSSAAYSAVDAEKNARHRTLPAEAPLIRSSSETGVPPPKTRRFSRRCADSWTLEYACLALTVTSFACLIWILYHFDGTVVTQMPLDISVNTLIAITTAVIKSSLLLPVAEAIGQLKWKWFATPKPLLDFEIFDLASRGPWGALLLIFRLKTRYLVSLGAWITLLALAIDPFTQQIVRPILCDRTVPDSVARVPRANNLTGIATFVSGSRAHNLENEFGTAIHLGLLGEPGSIEFECSTGNCSFPDDEISKNSYQTLAWDSACIDVSPEVKAYRLSEEVPSTYYMPRFRNDTTGNETHRPEVGWGGSQVVTRSSGWAVGVGTGTEFFPEYWLGTDTGPPLFSFSALIGTIDWGCAGRDVEVMNATCRGVFAVECKIWPAIHDLVAKIELSDLNETMAETQPLNLSRAGFSTEWFGTSSRVVRNGSWASCDGSKVYTKETPVAVFNNTLWDETAHNFDPPPDDSLWYAEDCIYSIDSRSHAALVGYLVDIFSSGTVFGGTYGLQADSLEGRPWMKSLYRNGQASLSTIQQYVAQLAQSMSVYTRKWTSKNDPATSFATGKSGKSETCTQVRWAWVSFPASLVCLSLVFFVLTTVTAKGSESRKEIGSSVWKSSSLGLMFEGLDDGTRQKCEGSDPKSWAKHTKVSVTRTDSGFRLTQ